MLERLTVEGGNGGNVEREAGGEVSKGLFGKRAAYFRLTISPSVISFPAAATLAGVRRFSLPSCIL